MMSSLDYIRKEIGRHNYESWVHDALVEWQRQRIADPQVKLYEFINRNLRDRYESRKEAFKESSSKPF